MDELLKNLNNVGWWLSAVVVGVLVNFLSQFLYPRLAAVPSKSLDVVRRAFDERQAKFDHHVNVLKENPVRLPIFIAVEHRLYWIASFLFGSAIALLLWVVVLANMHVVLPSWAQPVMLGLSALSSLIGMRAGQNGFEIGRAITIATHEW